MAQRNPSRSIVAVAARAAWFALAATTVIVVGGGCQSPPHNFGENPSSDYWTLTAVDRIIGEGDEAAKAGRYDAALESYVNACHLNPGDERVLWRIALAANSCGRPRVGVTALRMLVGVNPSFETDPDVIALARDLTGRRAAELARHELAAPHDAVAPAPAPAPEPVLAPVSPPSSDRSAFLDQMIEDASKRLAAPPAAGASSP